MEMILVSVISFILGGLVTAKNSKFNEDYIKLKSKIELTENMQEIIKRDFVQIANEAIKREQEDLRKQNKEALEEKISPLTKELGEFKEKVELFNLKAIENTTKIVEQISNLEKNNNTNKNIIAKI